MTRPVSCFFAYPSREAALCEVIETAVDEINRRGRGAVTARIWKTLAVGGKLIVDEVCRAIDESDVFVCDVTRLNANVLFELGYAIARNKRIWILLDPSYPAAKTNYNRLRALTTVGYAGYNNADEVAEAFFTEGPFRDLEATIYARAVEPLLVSNARRPALLYLKSQVNTEASRQLSRRLRKFKIPLVVEDPQEVSTQTLAWYACNTYASCAVVAHFLDTERAATTLQNATYSLVCGMAYGFGKPLLMLAHAEYTAPIDYRDILVVHDTAAACVAALDGWLVPIEREYVSVREAHTRWRARARAAVTLQRINLGEPWAENEKQELDEYFVETAAYVEALRPPRCMIYVGPKGAGKTANLFAVESALQRRPENHVCVVKPSDYELEGVVRLLKLARPRSEQGYLIESLWKYLIYTEIARSVYDRLEARPVHTPLSPEERAFLSFFEDHRSLVEPEFTVRMEDAIASLCGLDISVPTQAQRARVSELLHAEVLAGLRGALGKVLQGKRRVCVLVDNLDKAWTKRDDLGVLSDLLYGLLGIGRVIAEEFHKPGVTWHSTVNLSQILFLRSDIFSYIMADAREADKMAHARIQWDDPALLRRVIEERFLSNLPEGMATEDIWTEFFAPTVEGIPTPEYVTSRIMPRPRDIVVLCKAGLAEAVNHKHTRIEEQDILRAEMEYSRHAFSTLVAETATQVERAQEFLYEFVGAHEILTRDTVLQFAKKAAIPDGRVDATIDAMVASSFLGREIGENKFDFGYDATRTRVVAALARKTAELTGRERFAINVPFHSYLEVQPGLWA